MDYKNNPLYWGHMAWDYIFVVADGSPDDMWGEYSQLMKEWLFNVILTLPCDECTQHAITFVTENKPDFVNKQWMLYYVERLRNHADSITENHEKFSWDKWREMKLEEFNKKTGD